MNLSHIQTNRQLAHALGYDNTSALTYLSFNTAQHYRKYRIPKRKPGEFRDIYDPDASLRKVQYRLLVNVWDKFEILPVCYAFEPGKSIPQMVHKHVGKDIVLSFDIKNFFPSIKAGTLVELLTKEGMGYLPAKTVAELCTYKFFVPQGALTSPKISNIIASTTFGPQVQDYCTTKGLELTIYADDLTISSQGVPNILEVKSTVAEILDSHGFRVNTKKTKVMSKKDRQWVCGVVVNQKPNLLLKERKILRAIVHNVSKNGVEAEASKTSKTPEEFVRYVRGRLNWFKQLNPEQGGVLWAQWGQLTHGNNNGINQEDNSSAHEVPAVTT